jgi:hypothetical protein
VDWKSRKVKAVRVGRKEIMQVSTKLGHEHEGESGGFRDIYRTESTGLGNGVGGVTSPSIYHTAQESFP